VAVLTPWCVALRYLRVVHVPDQAALLRVQDEVAPQELAAALHLLDVQEAADAVVPIHVRHGGAGTFPGPAGAGTGEDGEVLAVAVTVVEGSRDTGS